MQIIGIAIISTALCLVIKKDRPEIAMFIGILTGVIILTSVIFKLGFIIDWQINLLNHNLPQLLTKNHKKISTMRLMHRAFVYHSVTSLINILSLYLPFLLALASLNLSSSPSVIPLALAMA